MKRTLIVPKGVIERYNKENGERGECALLMNMRERNESLEAVGKWTELANIVSAEHIILVDRRGDSNYYFSLRAGEVYLHGVRTGDVYTILNKAVCSAGGDVQWAQSVGGFVVIGTTGGFKYLYFDGSEYVEINREGMEPQLIFKAINTVSITGKVPGADFAESYTRWSALEERDRLKLQSAVTYAYEAMLDSAESKGAFVQPVAVRYAVRLWDDSYAWVSALVIVGAGVQCQSMVSSAVNSSLSGYDDGTFTAEMYNIGVTVIKSPSQEWRRLIKSIDVLVSEEMTPFDKGGIVCRCESSSGSYYVSYGFSQRERSVAVADMLNPERWRVIARVTDIDTLPELSVVLRSGLYSDTLDRADVAMITKNMAREVVANTGINLNGRLCTAGHSHIMRNAWKSAQYWGSEIAGQSCEVIVTVKLRTINGDAVKVNTESYDYTPMNLNPLICYPDSRTKELNIKILSNNAITEWTGTLASIDEQGMAYFVNSELENNTLSKGYSFYEVTEQNTIESRLTELITSLTGNPFVVGQCRNVGQGEVQYLAVAAKPIFSGVFGRYPVYAFSTDGIYAVAYKSTGDYKDAQLISRRRIGASPAIASSGEDVYFVSSSGEVCAMSGKDVRVQGKEDAVVQLVWADEYRELIVRHDDNTVSVYMPSGRRFERDSGLRNVYGDFHNAIGEDINGKLVDMNAERQGVVPVSLETYPVAVKDGALAAPLEFGVNINGTFNADGYAELYGGDGVACEWRELYVLHLNGDCCHRVSSRVYARPCRLVKVRLAGNAEPGMIIRDFMLCYS